MITNFESDPEVKQTVSYIRSGLGNKFSIVRITKVLKKVTTVITYQFQIEVKYSQSVILNYVIFITQDPLTGQLDVQNMDYSGLPKLNFQNMRQISNIRDTPLITEI